MPRLALFALLLCPALALAGGKRCALAEDSRRVPGLDALAGVPGTGESAPAGLRLTPEQVDVLYEVSERARELRASAARRLEGLPRVSNPEPEPHPKSLLTSVVTHSVFLEVREKALVIDVESSPVFAWARYELKNGEEKTCPVCVAVRDAVAAPFRFEPEDFEGGLPDKGVEPYDAAAALLQSAREVWVKGLTATLTKEQLSWLRDRQERWLEKAVERAVAAGLRKVPADFCGNCRDREYAPKCRFCLTVENAVRAATGEE